MSRVVSRVVLAVAMGIATVLVVHTQSATADEPFVAQGHSPTTGTPVAVASMLNRQQPFGGDVISRISATMLDDRALARLQQAAAETMAALAAQVCEEARRSETERLLAAESKTFYGPEKPWNPQDKYKMQSRW